MARYKIVKEIGENLIILTVSNEDYNGSLKSWYKESTIVELDSDQIENLADEFFERVVKESIKKKFTNLST